MSTIIAQQQQQSQTAALEPDARAALQTLHLVQRYTEGLSRSRKQSQGHDVAYLGAWYQRWREVQQDRAIAALKELGMESPATQLEAQKQ